jgi:30S ribosomal protein S31
MGKGDKKSRRGKIHIGSHGTRRPRKTGKYVPGIAVPQVKEETAKPIERTPKAVVKEKPVEPVTEEVAEVKKPARKTTKKPKEEAKEE